MAIARAKSISLIEILVVVNTYHPSIIDTGFL